MGRAMGCVGLCLFCNSLSGCEQNVNVIPVTKLSDSVTEVTQTVHPAGDLCIFLVAQAFCVAMRLGRHFGHR